MKPDNPIDNNPIDQTGERRKKPEISDRGLIYEWVKVTGFQDLIS
jgi:hypothetical protein